MYTASNHAINLYNIAKTAPKTATADESDKHQIVEQLNRLPTLYNAEHRIYPLLYKRANELRLLPQLNKHSLSLLKTASYRANADHLAKQQILQQLEPSLREQNLAIILLKSSAFNGSIYQNGYLRACCDLDILVPAQQLASFENSIRPNFSKYQPPIKRPFDDSYESTWIHSQNRALLLDVHKNISPPNLFTPNHALLWQRSQMHPLYQSKVIRMLSVEDNLIHLATHIFKDCNFYNYNLLDIHELISHNKVNWPLLVQLTKEWSARTVTYHALRICQIHLHTSVPPLTLDALKPSRFEDTINKFICRNSKNIPTVKNSARRQSKKLVYQLCLCDRVSSSLRNISAYMAKKMKLSS